MNPEHTPGKGAGREAAVQTLTDRLYADGELGPGYMLREDCEHLARRILIALSAVSVEEWGVETRWGMEWGAPVGKDHRYEYTAESVWGLASGRPVYKRTRTTFPPIVSGPTRVPSPGECPNDHGPDGLIPCWSPGGPCPEGRTICEMCGPCANCTPGTI